MIKAKNKQGKNILFLLIVFIFFVNGCQKSLQDVRVTEFALGAPLTIQIFSGGSTSLAKEVFSHIKKIEQDMSSSTKDYKNTQILDINALSVYRLREQGGAFEYEVFPSTRYVLQKSLKIARLTNGAFDPTIAPLVALWGFGTDSFQVPSEKQIQESLKYVSWKGLSVSADNKIKLLAGQQLDAGGIAKGYASDIAASMLKKAGVEQAIIDFGGNIRTLGETKKDGTKWKIGIQNPSNKLGNIVGFIKVGETSVITSGVYERFFEKDGKKYFHLLNSKTGYPARNGLASVSIVKKEGVEADGLSTGAFVLGLEKGLALIEKLENTEAIFVTETKEVFVTSGIVDNFEFVADDYKLGVAPIK